MTKESSILFYNELIRNHTIMLDDLKKQRDSINKSIPSIEAEIQNEKQHLKDLGVDAS